MRGWDVGVGAVSPLAVSVARQLRDKGVPTVIIASRNQCPGYAFATREDLIDAAGPVPVIRDHGGPLQGPVPDIGLLDLIDDVDAGFAALHVDVAKLPDAEQSAMLRMLLRSLVNNVKVADRVPIEVGDERDRRGDQNNALMLAAEYAAGVVAPAGTRCLALRQVGSPSPTRVKRFCVLLPPGMGVVLHNADWCSSAVLDALFEVGCTRVNVAPEVALAEVDAVYAELTHEERVDLQSIAFISGRWGRWFPDVFARRPADEKARAATHYVLQYEIVQRIVKDAYRSGRAEAAVREAILRVA